MNTSELSCVLQRSLRNCKVRFLGVFPADEVPKCTSKFPLCFVANTDAANNPGEHWVACWCESSEQFEFFDSAGMLHDVYPQLRIPYKVTQHNVVQLQQLSSNACGHFCIYFLLARAHGYSFSSIIRTLSGVPPALRDDFVKRHLATVVARLSIDNPCRSMCVGQQCCKSFYRVRTNNLLQ